MFQLVHFELVKHHCWILGRIAGEQIGSFTNRKIKNHLHKIHDAFRKDYWAAFEYGDHDTIQPEEHVKMIENYLKELFSKFKDEVLGTG